MYDIIFYIFAFFLVASSVLVVSLRNPVHAVLLLITCFFSASALFLMLGAEFIAMTLVIVYVGAVAVLFLFVVMMLNVNVSQIKQGFVKNAPFGIFVVCVIFLQLFLAIRYISVPAIASIEAESQVLTNTEAIGMVLYTDYFLAFQIAGFILLVAMIGAIILTLGAPKNPKRQDIMTQVMRDPKESLKLVKMKIGEGVEI